MREKGAVVAALVSAARFLWERLVRYALKFGVVGAVGFIIDVSLFNALRLGVFGTDHLFSDPLGAKAVSVSVAIVFNWLGNRYWTFREHRRRRFLREFAEYSVVSLGGMLVGLICLWMSHYVLGFTSLVADNIASNVVGLALGTLFRFVLYRYWVWGHHRQEAVAAAHESKIDAAELALFVEGDAEPAEGEPT